MEAVPRRSGHGRSLYPSCPLPDEAREALPRGAPKGGCGSGAERLTASKSVRSISVTGSDPYPLTLTLRAKPGHNRSQEQRGTGITMGPTACLAFQAQMPGAITVV